MRSFYRKKECPIKRIHKAWLMLLGCILIYFGNTGILLNCTGLMFTAIVEAEKYAYSSLSLFYSIRSLGSAALTMPITYLLRKLPMQRWLPLAVICPALGYALMTVYTQPWHWYLSAVLAAVGMSSTLLVIPNVINNWFYSRSATAMGICMAAGGIGGAVFSPITAGLITALGWRPAIMILSILSLLLMEIAACLILVRSPKERGMEPYREPESDRRRPVPAEEFPLDLGPTGRILVIFLAVFCGGLFVQFTSFLPQYSWELGRDLAFGAALTTMVMLGNTGFKLLIGYVCDKLGVWLSTMLCYLTLILSFVLFLFGSSSPLLLQLGALLLGVAYSVNSTSSAPLCRMAFSREQFATYFGRFTTFNNFAGAGFVYLAATVMNGETGFQRLCSMGLALSILVLIYLGWLRRLSRKRTAGL